jgi:hypothetical protein
MAKVKVIRGAAAIAEYKRLKAEAQKPKRGRGRPPQYQPTRAQFQGKAKRGRGRPKGSKNVPLAKLKGKIIVAKILNEVPECV